MKKYNDLSKQLGNNLDRTWVDDMVSLAGYDTELEGWSLTNKIPVNVGDKIYVKTNINSSACIALWSLYETPQGFFTYVDGTLVEEPDKYEFEFTIPDNVAYIKVSCLTDKKE